MTGDLLAGAVAGLAVAMPVGAVGAYLVGLAARERFPTAAAAALGVATIDGAYAIVAAAVGVGLQPLLSRLAGPLSVAAALVLVAVALRTVQTALRRYRAGGGSARTGPLLSARRAYLTLLAMTAVNPATVITFVAVVLGRGATDGLSWASVVLFSLGAFVASSAWQLLLAGGGTLLGRLLRGRRGQLGIAGCSAAIMVGLALVIVTGT